MGKQKKIIWVIAVTITTALLILYGLPASGTEYYVDYENGSDLNNGTSPTTPWKHCPGDERATDKPAMTALSPGDIVNLKGGVHYRGSFSITWSGEPDRPIVYRTAPGWGTGKAVIDGSVPLTGWNKCTSQAECLNNTAWPYMYYKDITIPAHLSKMPGLSILLHQNDKLLVTAQYPTSTEIGYQTTNNYYSVPPSAVTTSTLTDYRLAQLGGKILVGKYIYLWVQPNEVAMSKIIDFNEKTNTITWADNLNVYTDRNSLYAVANVPVPPAFERPGTYYLDENESRLYVIPYDYADINSSQTITMSVLPSGINISGAYVLVDGIIIQKQSGETFGQGNSVNVSRSATNCVIRNCEIRYTKGFSGGYSTNSWADGVVVENNFFHDISGNLRGCVFGGNNVIIRNNVFDKQARTVIYSSGAKNSYIVGNIVRNSKGVHGNSITVYQGSENVLVAGNVVTNSNLATFEDSTNIIWFNNYIENGITCWGKCEKTIISNNTCLFGGINIYSTNEKLIVNNIAYNFNGEYGSTNIRSYRRDMSSIFRKSARIPAEPVLDLNKMEVINNIDFVYIDDGYENIVKQGDILVFSGEGVKRTVSSVTRVIFGGNHRTRISFSPNADLGPYIVSVWPGDMPNLEYDVHLKMGSAAIDAGVNAISFLPTSVFPIYDFNKDLEGVYRPQGSAWDIGAYEYSVPGAPNAPKNLQILPNGVDGK
ncbi:MAG: right-handed parallel beta-helix repeat-containing protein [Candidatus Verstraetearchaeota archaeon]|nr:right-handed parallel beta-helix repeat-containing protein [Candidatus Verstraetearchaeota archaeon]